VQGSLSVERMCQLAPVEPGGILPQLAGAETGGRRHGGAVGGAASGFGTSTTIRLSAVTPELRRRGFLVNHKRVSAIMRETTAGDRTTQFVVTTESGTGWKWR